MTQWLIDGTCDNRFPYYPSRVPSGGVKLYHWNERSLTAPKPYLVNGIYGLDPRRRVRPGLLPMPTGFIGLPDTKALTAALRDLVRNSNNAINELLAILANPVIKVP